MNIQWISLKHPISRGGSHMRNFYLLKNIVPHVEKISLDVFIYGKNQPITDEVQHNFPHISYSEQAIAPMTFLQRAWFALKQDIPYIQRLAHTQISQNTLERYLQADIIQIQELETFAVLEKVIPQLRAAGVKIILDAHNVEFNKFSQEISLHAQLPRYWRDSMNNHMRDLEIRAAQSVDVLIACSQVDADYFASLKTKAHIVVIPNGVDLVNRESHPINQRIIFTGSMGYFANQEAIRWYLEKMHSQIRERHPAMSLQVIGMDPPDWLTRLAQSKQGVEVLGAVKDMREYLAQASVAICPLLHGSGTRLKILEYMAHGLPIVSTRKGAEGLPVEDGKHVLFADEAPEFIQAMEKIIADPQLARHLSIHAKALVEEFAWPKLGVKLLTVYQELGI